MVPSKWPIAHIMKKLPVESHRKAFIFREAFNETAASDEESKFSMHELQFECNVPYLKSANHVRQKGQNIIAEEEERL